MSPDQDAGTDELGDQKAPVGPSDAEVEAQIRTEFGPQLLATTGLHRFGESCLYNWVGRSVDADSVDAVILGEAARATKTLGGVARLAAGGYGQQGAMLVRSLFEGMATAHWAHAHPTEAIDLLARHSRHSAALWREALANADPDVELPPDQVSPEERDDLDALFGRYGTKLWTGHSGLRALLPDIEQLWLSAEAREGLWWYWRIVHRDNNQVVHSTVGALRASAARTSESLVLDAGPSDSYLDRAMLGGCWCYVQTLSLVWDHFGLPKREELDAITDATFEAFGQRSGSPESSSGESSA